MARTQARILNSIWRDPDWITLTGDAQRLYFLLLGQPRLTLAGTLDYMPERWAKLACDTERGDISATLEELADARFVVVHYDELLIRSFTKNDLGTGTVNKNLVKGMWSAWAGIISPLLRKVAVDNMPEALLNRDGVEVPEQALELRSEPRLELPLGLPTEPPEVLNPETRILKPEPVSAPVSGPLTTPDPEPLTADEIEQSTNRAVGKLANLRAIGGDNPGALARHIGENLPAHERAELRDLIVSGMTAENAAAALADPLRGLDGIAPHERRHDPAEIARAAERAKEAEQATKKKLAEIAAAPERRMSRDELRALRSVPLIAADLTGALAEHASTAAALADCTQPDPEARTVGA